MTSRTLVLGWFLAAAAMVSPWGCAPHAAQSGADGGPSATGSSSSSGLCAELPFSGTSTPTPTSSPTCTSNVPVPVVSAGGAIFALAVDGKNVYWSVCGQDLDQVAVTGGTPLVLAQGSVMAIAVDPLDVYWADADGNVRKVPIGGGDATLVASAAGTPAALAVDATNVYWTASADGKGSVMQAPIGGGPVVVLASLQDDPRYIAVDATSVYWANAGNGAITKVPIGGGIGELLALTLNPGGTSSGGGATTVVPPSGPTGLAIDATSLYWPMPTQPLNTVIPGALLRVGKDGGSPITLASPLQVRTGAVAVDATNAYFTYPGSAPSVEACAKGDGGTQPSPIGDGPAPMPTDPAFGPIALDETCVYWSTYAICTDGFGETAMCSPPGIWKAAKAP
jgi:hypothetical protein